MAWVAEMHAEGEWVPNCQYFATQEEAEANGVEMNSRWWVPDGHRAVEVDKPVNYRFDFEKFRAVRLDNPV